jgi:hypothetical protein
MLYPETENLFLYCGVHGKHVGCRYMNNSITEPREERSGAVCMASKQAIVMSCYRRLSYYTTKYHRQILLIRTIDNSIRVC